MKRLLILQLAGNAVLLWLAYVWLGVGESSIPRLLWSAILALAILAAFCWLHGDTLAWFRGGRIGQRVVVFLLAAIAVIVLYGLLSRFADTTAQWGFQLASYLTLKFRKPVKPATIQRIFSVGWWLVRWVLLPLVLLPIASGMATRGRPEWGWKGRGWLLVPFLLLAGLWLPFVLLGWVPRVGGFWLQMVSFAIRFGLAYLLFVGAAVALAAVTSRGRPDFSQPKTVVSP